ncbi:hypothetical protein CYMTET_8691 [Cymbomonas tetramitiformis]|uniref:Uncharacterized protein n=1 Tax=Cymbomonas tetramitiformis TaxID=36881 RepID=A0AAE0GSZ4_9CHLO|nr:hypothetical protein CYMTET_8691 [Cymbomonas tetramitiformis]
MLHIVSENLKGKSIQNLEASLLRVAGLESAIKGHRLQSGVAANSANWLKFVAVSEEAAQKIERGTVEIPDLEDYKVQQVALMKDVDKQAETKAVVVDTGSVIDPEFDLEALARAVDEVLNTALGDKEHLVPQLAVPSYPATDKEDVGTYARLRQLHKGRLYYFILSDDAYRWLVAQEGSQVKVTVEHKGMYFYLRPSDYSRNGKRSRGRPGRAAGITRDDSVVQALEARLGTFAEAVKAATTNGGGGGETEEAIRDLGLRVQGLSEKVEKGFEDTVDNVKKVNASVDKVDKSVVKVIDLTGQVLTRQDKHLALADKQNQIANAMLQNLAKLNGSSGSPTTRTASKGVRKRGAVGTPNSDTGEDTDMDREAVLTEIEQLKKLRKEVCGGGPHPRPDTPGHLPHVWYPRGDGSDQEPYRRQAPSAGNRTMLPDVCTHLAALEEQQAEGGDLLGETPICKNMEERKHSAGVAQVRGRREHLWQLEGSPG